MEVKALNLTGHETVLEIGSGDGRMTKLIAERAKRVVAIEKDEALMAAATAISWQTWFSQTSPITSHLL